MSLLYALRDRFVYQRKTRSFGEEGVILQSYEAHPPTNLDISPLSHHDASQHSPCSFWGRCASPANVFAPRDRVELKVIEGELTGERIGHKLVDALDLGNALAEPVDDPAESDVGAVVEDLEDLEGRGGWCVEQRGDVRCLVGEGDGVKLDVMLD